MNFGYKETVNKQLQLTSLKRKLSTKALVLTFKLSILAFLVIMIIGGLFGLGVARGIIDNAPDISSSSIMPQGWRSAVYDSDKNKTATLVTSGSNRELVALEKIPLYTQHAFVCIEDERFYEHNGIDVRGIFRAAYVAITSRNLSEGASTITQQVLKNNVFTSWTSEANNLARIKRKLQEQYLAIQLEKTTSKDQILYSYLNTINLGANTLGIKQAAKRYFNKTVDKLTISESAVLAGITQNPSKYNPITHPEYNAERRERVLTKMLEQKYITKAEYDEAEADDVYSRIQKVDSKFSTTSSPYSYFVDELIEQVADDLQEYKGYTSQQAYNALYAGGLKIYSTQDAKMQEIADAECSDDANYPSSIQYSVNWAYSVQHKNGKVENYSEGYITYYHRYTLNDSTFKLIFATQEEAKACVESYKKAIKKKGDKVLGEKLTYTKQPQISFSVMEQDTGFVRAIVGGRGEKTASLTLNRATDTKRQPGSTIKPIGVYAPAIDAKGYSLDTTVVDEPYNYASGREVKNWYDGYKGTQTIKQAIEQSINVIAVKVITDITPELSYEYLKSFGISTLVTNKKLSDGTYATDIGQALALGGLTDGVKNVEMSAAYATIANGGIYHKPLYYTKVLDHEGQVILDNTKDVETHTVVKPSTAILINNALEATVNEGTATAAKIPNMHVAGKTGTTSNNYDLWFVGYTPYLTAAIWTGFDENVEMANGDIHTRLWQKIMSQITAETGVTDKKYTLPEAIRTVDICDDSGMIANGNCTNTHSVTYGAGEVIPTEICNWHNASTKNESSNGSDGDGSYSATYSTDYYDNNDYNQSTTTSQDTTDSNQQDTTTQAPTAAPTTQAPTTQAPTTQAPTTQAPTTQAPTEAPTVVDNSGDAE